MLHHLFWEDRQVRESIKSRPIISQLGNEAVEPFSGHAHSHSLLHQDSLHEVISDKPQ